MCLYIYIYIIRRVATSIKLCSRRLNCVQLRLKNIADLQICLELVCYASVDYES